MSIKRTGKVIGVNGNMVAVAFDTLVMQNEVAFVVCGEEHLKAEVIRVKGRVCDLQVFEDTQGVRAGDAVEFSDELLSVELGPGLLGRVFDGLQNPLEDLARTHGFFLRRGAYLDALDRASEWEFTPVLKKGDRVRAGDCLGTVPEKIVVHAIMAPFYLDGEWEVVEVSAKGVYGLSKVVARLRNDQGETADVTMIQVWPVKVPVGAYVEKVKPVLPLVTKMRIIDTLVPVALGGTFCTPGPFGAGKTVLQHKLSQHAEVDIVIIAACGERAGEVVEILKEFPALTDPRTGRSLMDRTVVICNTSSMPVAARESSVYTAVTIAEYYRQMGLHVLLLADSTSRWAQAMREMSGRLEEIPGEEAFPAYLESRIASFYERAGCVRLRNGKTGSVTIGGAVSPAGGNFEEPVTQATLKVAGAFHGLSRARANARRYPAIDPLESWSKYDGVIEAPRVERLRAVLRSSGDVGRMMKVVGEEGTHINDFLVYLKGEFFDAVYLQQNAFDRTDEASSAERQRRMFAAAERVIDADFAFSSKEDARRVFQELRLLFIDWNSREFMGVEFIRIEGEILLRLGAGVLRRS